MPLCALVCSCLLSLFFFFLFFSQAGILKPRRFGETFQRGTRRISSRGWYRVTFTFLDFSHLPPSYCAVVSMIFECLPSDKPFARGKYFLAWRFSNRLGDWNGRWKCSFPNIRGKKNSIHVDLAANIVDTSTSPVPWKTRLGTVIFNFHAFARLFSSRVRRFVTTCCVGTLMFPVEINRIHETRRSPCYDQWLCIRSIISLFFAFSTSLSLSLSLYIYIYIYTFSFPRNGRRLYVTWHVRARGKASSV